MIESEWVPAYGPDGFSAAIVFNGEQPAFGQLIARYNEQVSPTVWDIEQEVLRRFRIEGVVFPLRVLLDADGNVILKATGEETDPSLGLDCLEEECPCDGRGHLCLTRDAIEDALGL